MSAAAPSASARMRRNMRSPASRRTCSRWPTILRRALDSLPEAEARDRAHAQPARRDRRRPSANSWRSSSGTASGASIRRASASTTISTRRSSRPSSRASPAVRSSRCCSPATCCTTACCGPQWSASPRKPGGRRSLSNPPTRWRERRESRSPPAGCSGRPAHIYNPSHSQGMTEQSLPGGSGRCFPGPSGPAFEMRSP